MRKAIFGCIFFYTVATGCNNSETQKVETKQKVTQSKPNLVDKEAPSGMVYIPSGSFEMGGKSAEAYENEYPAHKVSVSAFYMDETEVTNQQFLEFVKATGYTTIAERDVDWEEVKKQVPAGTPKPPDSVLQAGALVFHKTDGPVNLEYYPIWWKWTIGANWKHPLGTKSSIKDIMNHPVVHIAWDDAFAYATWAGKRLPTESEWEWAAMGGDAFAKYPWGNESPETAYKKANFWQGGFPYSNTMLDGYDLTAPVKMYPPNGYGLYEMGGNVWEWCRDKYNVHQYELNAQEGTLENPIGATTYLDPTEPNVPKHILRGGSFLCNDTYCSGYRVARRMSSSKDSGLNHTGFRCVQEAL